MSIPQNFPIDSSTIPVNPSPTLISGAMEIDLLNTVVELSGLNVPYNLYYEPTQITIKNNSTNIPIFWMVLTYDQRIQALRHPTNFDFFKLDIGISVSSSNTRGRFVYLYNASAGSTGIVTIEATEYWKFSQDFIV